MAKMHDVTQVHGQVVNVADDITVISTGISKLWGIYINTTLSAHALRIEDAAGTLMIQIPASDIAGTYFKFPGFLMNGITVDPDNAATGSITIMWSEV